MENMKYSGIKSIGLIPSDWHTERIKNILSLRSEKNSGDRELLSVYLDKGVISYSDSTGMQVHKPSADLSNYQNVHVGDFVMNNQQAWRGSVGVSKYDSFILGKTAKVYLDKETLDNLKKSKIYRTDIDGSIMFKIKNNRLKIETCSP